jgi:hypothetical protein
LTGLATLPFTLEVTADLTQLQLPQISPPNQQLSTLLASGLRADMPWLLSYKIEQPQRKSSHLLNKDIATIAIEAIIISQFIDRLSGLINEAIDIQFENKAINKDYDTESFGVIARSDLIRKTFSGLIPPVEFLSTNQHVWFELLSLEPGTLKAKFLVLIASLSLAGCVSTAENIDKVGKEVLSDVYQVIRVVRGSDEQDQQRTEFSTHYKEQLLKQLKRHDMTLLQQSLQNLGYSPGAVDGRVGPLTIAALHAFERAHNLPAMDPDKDAEALAQCISNEIAVRIVVTPKPVV